MKKQLTLVFTFILMLALTACGGSQSSSADSGRMEKKMAAPMDADAGAAYNGDYESADFSYDEAVPEEAVESDGAEAPEEVGEGDSAGKGNSRKLITTVNIEAETADVEALANRIEQKVTALGGYIESSNVYSNSRYDGDISKSASITARVPADGLDSFLNDVDGNANITGRSTNTEDVTLHYADTEAHERALTLEQQSLEKMMSMAETVEDVMAIQSQLTDVRYRLDSIRSQLRTYDNDINYSTVHLSIMETEKFTVTEKESVLDRIKNGFVDNLLEVMDAIAEFLIWFITHIPAIIVFIVIVFAIVMIVRGLILAGKGKGKKAKPVPVNRKQAPEAGEQKESDDNK